MSLLHPYYIIAIIYMMIFSFQEVYSGKTNKGALYVLAVFLVIIAGFRDDVGPDYGSYVGIYVYSDTKDYLSIFLAALSIKGSQVMEQEWLYVLINKILINIFDAPFYMLTFVIAALVTFFKTKFVEENTHYPFTFLLFVFIPGFFIGESGQIRQNLGCFMAYWAIRYIKERNLWMYLLWIYLAAGIHNVCYLMLPMYWVARIPLNKFWMLLFILICVFLSPFEVYRYFGDLLGNLASESTLVEGFNGYIDESVERLNGGFGIPEAMLAICTAFLFIFDTKMKEKYPYYEYHRNYTVIGICFYFIFRNNPIFSSRLTGTFLAFSYILIPNTMFVVSKGMRAAIHSFIITLVIFNFIVFSSFKNITAGRFTIDLYHNHILP
ncbi:MULTISPECIES: EpsG family protein [unclassified Chryseobacterium]|uniref:EpsG family protein n=1 Tax=unclassified Chryseobacterium TaxID=2593645 RepID=UPI00100A3471|nr:MULTISPECIES: EpsG family protein [unclassified Chryseobacterium]RXM50842.1 capsular biosynthesis protein [Chryseobacterium sp. CH25]RXM61906.1 capsular biosynthesis protein [Chryseobacterium sp. CH1]